jgi:hypothetical protein
MWYLSRRVLYEGVLEGGLLYWGFQKTCSLRYWKQTSVSIGDPLLGNMGVAPFIGPLGEDINFFISENFVRNLRDT